MARASFATLIAFSSLAVGCKSQPTTGNPALLDPSAATQQAPETFRVTFETTKGGFAVACTRAWAPNGVDRFYNLVKIGFFDDVAFFRVVMDPRPFVAQFGLHGNPDVNAKWTNANVPPDPPKESNTRGRLTFAMAGSPDTRSTQLFFNYGNNANLDKMGFSPICEVTDNGMVVLESLYGGYGESLTEKQGRIGKEGNAFLKKEHPLLDYIKTARLEER